MKKRTPRFQECLRLMRSHDPMVQEEGFYTLLPQAHKYTPQLMEAFTQETNLGLRCWLLELLSEAKNPAALPLFLEYLHCDDRMLKYYAMCDLKLLDTKETRRILWEVGRESSDYLQPAQKIDNSL